MIEETNNIVLVAAICFSPRFFFKKQTNNRFTKPIPLAEVSLVRLPSVQVLVYSQATAQSFPH